MDVSNIVICGGHFSPASAVIEELKWNPKYKIYYIGRKEVLEGDRSESLEYSTIVRLKIPFFPITAGRLQRSFTIYTLPSLAKFPIGFWQSICLLKKIRPALVLSFGGYVALTVCLSAWLLNIPIVTHEQTSILGLSNRIIRRFAKIICLSWPNTKYAPVDKKTIVTGNPMRENNSSNHVGNLTKFGNLSLPLLYITGGSLGAKSINQVVSKIIPQLVKKFRVLHQCGAASNGGDFRKLLNLKNSLPSATKRNYKVMKHVNPQDINSVLNKALLVISRAGANTVAEIGKMGVPAILIPLPWAAENEQESNAKLLETVGLARIIQQKEMTAQKLLDMIDFMQNNIFSFQNNRDKTKALFHNDAARKIVLIVEKLTS